MVRAYAATRPGGELTQTEVALAPLGDDEVEVVVEHCGICHSDLSMLRNDWGSTTFPLVPGHEVIGTVVARGAHVSALHVGQRVGVGWYSRSCMHCRDCLGGDQHLCAEAQSIIVGRHGGFAERLRVHWAWATPLPDGLDPTTAGPLFCGGITVFNPLVMTQQSPTGRVGVIGIGGLGHLAVQFAAAWGCEVVAFTSSLDKTEEIRNLGAHRVIDSRDPGALRHMARSLDLIISTVNVPLPWDHYLAALRPNGRLHLVGAVLEPIPAPAFALIGGQKAITGSPLGSPATVMDMLEFAARHHIAPVVERLPMAEVNRALARLESGQARYRIILDADF